MARPVRTPAISMHAILSADSIQAAPLSADGFQRIFRALGCTAGRDVLLLCFTAVLHGSYTDRRKTVQRSWQNELLKWDHICTAFWTTSYVMLPGPRSIVEEPVNSGVGFSHKPPGCDGAFQRQYTANEAPLGHPARRRSARVHAARPNRPASGDGRSTVE